jgi:glycosyltransferase involved in cell wall biosynthesis
MISSRLEHLPMVSGYNSTQRRRLLDDFVSSASDCHIFQAPPLELPRKPDYLIYDCMDNWAAFPGASDDMADREVQLCEAADRIWVTSRGLAARLEGKFASKLEYLPNAADVGHFQPVPSMKVRTARPVLGFVGWMGEWFDDELVASVSRLLRGWDILLVGPDRRTRAQKARLIQPNIHYLGVKAYEDLPRFLASVDVAMIPLRLDDLVRCVNPVKLYEYLAAGIPVVSTPLPEVVPHEAEGVLELASDPAEFASAAQRLLGSAQAAKCQEIARNNSWRARFVPAVARVARLRECQMNSLHRDGVVCRTA